MVYPFRVLFLFCILLCSSISFASEYNNDTLNIFSKISPRLILMSSQKEKLKNTINICVLHDKIDKNLALSLIDKTDNSYPNGIKNYKIIFTKNNYANIENCENSQLLFLFNTDDNNIKKTLEYAQKKKILTISYDQKLLENGVDISLFLGRKIIPYINVENIVKKDIVLNNILLRISKIYKRDK